MPDPELEIEGGVQKTFFSPQPGLKIRGAQAPPLEPPLGSIKYILTANNVYISLELAKIKENSFEQVLV